MAELNNVFNNEVELNGVYGDEIMKVENYVEQSKFDPFDISNTEIEIEESVNGSEQNEPELTEWQRIYQEMDINLDDKTEYEALITGVKISDKRLDLALDAYVKGLTKKIWNCYFFSSHDSIMYSISLIKELANKLGIGVSKNDFASMDTVVRLCKRLIGKKVIIVPKTRIDDKTGKSYQNYDVRKMSDGSGELGGNL